MWEHSASVLKHQPGMQQQAAGIVLSYCCQDSVLGRIKSLPDWRLSDYFRCFCRLHSSPPVGRQTLYNSCRCQIICLLHTDKHSLRSVGKSGKLKSMYLNFREQGRAIASYWMSANVGQVRFLFIASDARWQSSINHSNFHSNRSIS